MVEQIGSGMLNNEKLKQINARYGQLERDLMDGIECPNFVEISREYNDLRPIVEKIQQYWELKRDIKGTESMQTDPELRSLAEEELVSLRQALQDAETGLMRSLLPKDADADRSAILEIRAGTGGDEAALFAGDLYRLYERYALSRGWSFNRLAAALTELGGFREATVEVRGKGAFARLKFESGVHRVQRVPSTESSGRIHTSAATVAVLPEVEDVEVEILQSDLRIETMRASGAGGQHVNKTDSAVRMTHLPTGIVVNASEKSQHQNRASAMKVLKSRLYESERQRAQAARSAERRQLVGSGDRSERIRTYNFPQGRITDHRIDLTLYKLEQVLAGGLDELVDALIANDQAEQLADLGG